MIVKAKVKCVLELTLDTNWDKKCNVEQVFVQAVQEARRVLPQYFDDKVYLKLLEATPTAIFVSEGE